jgi:beta-ribofuranosylaminobenzene 5'-phosphate synthase
MARARVTANARVHFGFQNLSLAHERLYGGMGAALSAPRAVVEAEPATGVDAPEVVAAATERAVEVLGVEGASVRIPESIPRHVGLGSGTQHALGVYAAVAAAHGIDPATREAAPDLGRGGRSGVGVAAFEGGGFVVDAGHPTGQFTTDRPAVGEWTVPAVAARHELPDDWRVLLVRPDAEAGRSGETEAVTMREVVEDADAGVADRIAGILTRQLLPAAAEGDLESFGDALAEISRLNGAWYADEQGGVFRPPVGPVVDRLAQAPEVVGAGQSSWGPTAFGLTEATQGATAREAGRAALAAAGVDGTVELVPFADRGATVELVSGAGSDK